MICSRYAEDLDPFEKSSQLSKKIKYSFLPSSSILYQNKILYIFYNFIFYSRVFIANKIDIYKEELLDDIPFLNEGTVR